MSDLIDRQAAIDAVHKNYDVILDFTSDGQTISFSIEDILSELPSAQPRWIPYTPESEPKRCEYYLVTDDGYTEEAYLDCDGVWFSLYGNKLKDVTAWMEKPEPWEGGQDG